jgi:hypothetical protein
VSGIYMHVSLGRCWLSCAFNVVVDYVMQRSPRSGTVLSYSLLVNLLRILHAVTLLVLAVSTFLARAGACACRLSV